MYALQKLARIYLGTKLQKSDRAVFDFLKKNAEGLLDGQIGKLGFAAMMADKSLVPSQPLLRLLNACFPTVPQMKKAVIEFETSNWSWTIEALSSGAGFRSVRDFAFFWSIVDAEATFLRDFLPFCSHEERITGMLTSTMAMVAKDYSAICSVEKGPRVGPVAYLFDTATNSNEARTGADIGLIVRSGDLTNPLNKVARLQVKVSDSRNVQGQGNFRVANTTDKEEHINPKTYPVGHSNYKQLNSLLEHEAMGYYLVVTEPDYIDSPILPCLVVPAKKVADAIGTRNRADQTSGQSAILNNQIEPLPLAAFLAIGLTERESGYGYKIEVAGDKGGALERATEMLFGRGTPPQYGFVIDTTAEPLNPHLILAQIRKYQEAAAQPTIPPQQDQADLPATPPPEQDPDDAPSSDNSPSAPKF